MHSKWMRPTTMLLPVLALVLVSACAKAPNVRVASAPAPASPRTEPAPPPAPRAAEPAPPPPPVVVAPAPAPAPVVTARPATTPTPKEFEPNPALRPIYFDFDKSDIRTSDAAILEENAKWLRQNSNQLLLIEGHCDERGTNEYNLALGDRRARATLNFLVSRGVGNERITIISYGEERPVCSQSNEDCWAKNRRAMFLTKER